jgi:hypothetical protein
MKEVDGQMTGIRLKPLNYTNRTVVSIPDYTKASLKSLSRRKPGRL